MKNDSAQFIDYENKEDLENQLLVRNVIEDAQFWDCSGQEDLNEINKEKLFRRIKALAADKFYLIKKAIKSRDILKNLHLKKLKQLQKQYPTALANLPNLQLQELNNFLEMSEIEL